MIAVAVQARRREQGGEPVEEFEWGEPDHGTAVGRGPRQVVDHLAAARLSSRNLPVSVIAKDDPRTFALYTYYAAAIESLAEH